MKLYYSDNDESGLDVARGPYPSMVGEISAKFTYV